MEHLNSKTSRYSKFSGNKVLSHSAPKNRWKSIYGNQVEPALGSVRFHQVVKHHSKKAKSASSPSVKVPVQTPTPQSHVVEETNQVEETVTESFLDKMSTGVEVSVNVIQSLFAKFFGFIKKLLSHGKNIKSSASSLVSNVQSHYFEIIGVLILIVLMVILKFIWL